MTLFICKHGIDTDQVTCAQCNVDVDKSRATTNGGTPAANRTLREHFAGLAMQGLLATPEPTRLEDGTDADADECRDLIAQFAVEYADALIAALASGAAK